MSELTREALIAAAQGAAATAGPQLSRTDFTRLTGISEHQIARLFPGRWTELKREAGLAAHPMQRAPVSDDAILAEFHRVATEHGGIPTWAVFSHNGHVSAEVARKRFGGLQGTLAAYRGWLEANDPQSPLLEQLQVRSRHEIPTPPAVVEATTKALSGSWARVDGPVYGAPIDFRGLRHAPVNEQGVVFLFGMVAYELGFIVEAVHAAFPDCEAKRCIDVAHQKWQRVRVEFEHRSRTFLDHGHDPAGCDLIVCWEHNWPDCPLEVLELRGVLDRLGG